ncbi:MAG TPA: pilus assembly protein N-terminal domain-containing protein [bacterium]|nr:pilus assembly protein N-terminal domain-containing protein [bacterium]
MGHGAHGAVPQRARLSRAAALVCAAALAVLPPARPALAALPALTVYATPPAVRTSLHLQPGFALIVRADRHIDTVAIGDPRLVAAAPVHRGPDVFDVVLQPLADAGTTNMVLWLDDVTTVWTLDIGPGQRTTDVVFVVTQPHAAPAARPAPPAATVGTSPLPAGTTPPPAAAVPAGLTPGGPQATTLDLRETVGPVTAAFHASRTHGGVLLRYEITNGAGDDLVIRASSVLVRADGRPVAYGMGRDSVDRSRPDVIPRGATETGAIDIAVPSARRIELALSLFTLTPATSAVGTANAPAARTATTPATPLPIVLQATFSGLDRLAVTAGP